MRLFKYSLLITALVLSLEFPLHSHAQSVFLGNFNQKFFSSQLPAELALNIGDTHYNLSRAEISSWLNEQTKLVYNTHYHSEIENTDFCSYKKTLACQLFFSEKDQNHIQKISILNVNQDLINQFVKDLARQVNSDPQNAKLEIKNAKVSIFKLSKPGIQLDKNKSVIAIKNYLIAKNHPAILKLSYQKIKPEVSTNSINNLGITSLIGEGKSNFVGSPYNRVHNIEVSTHRFNGVLIKPKENFSFIKALGGVDKDHGYLPELVIKNNKTEPDFGGGICQVSTTAFRAAINSGLEITARTSHAYPVSYYNPQGMDATVYIPHPDLRFINDTPGYILIQTKIEGTELIFDFYGTSDGRKVNIIGPKILERKPDGSMKATFTQQVFDKNKQLIRQDIFNSNYASPSKYPHPGATTILTKKPKDWSKKQWKEYKKAH